MDNVRCENLEKVRFLFEWDCQSRQANISSGSRYRPSRLWETIPPDLLSLDLPPNAREQDEMHTSEICNTVLSRAQQLRNIVLEGSVNMGKAVIVDRERHLPTSLPSFNGQTPTCSEERVISCCEN
jgi:hypothetical protein